MGKGSEELDSYCWLEGKHAWAGNNVGRERVPDMNGSGLKGVDNVIGSALDLYIFMGVTISCLCTRTQDVRAYFVLEEAMVDFIKDCELGLESPSFQSLPEKFIQ